MRDSRVHDSWLAVRGGTEEGALQGEVKGTWAVLRTQRGWGPELGVAQPYRVSISPGVFSLRARTKAKAGGGSVELWEL